jgi:hypothetical protein
MAPVYLTIFIHDIHGRRYELRYELFVFKSPQAFIVGTSNLAPGLECARRYVVLIPWWKLRFQSERVRIRKPFRN